MNRPPAVSERLALTALGQVRYAPKTQYRVGTTHMVLEPLDLVARLAVTPARRGRVRRSGRRHIANRPGRLRRGTWR